ncbi:MerR family transcriptional regulator [Tardiphaga sp. 42S5]|uniref:MerR family transcriptional regulator n=1 Tax=Tardiphaga sp. 42S5 TaxID=1404799 RepID=UPI002A5ABEAE|nr:MerR family transcriptional regulator [Tardiphaga sp. 42S5]WPO39264.1 MerR family transcriptional regulator [Tardiphaga sp. 42S5]
MDKAPDAFRTISEVADDLDIPQHVLRFWETRFTQIKPMKRSGGRRYYRPDDVDLLRGIRRLLYGEGYTIRGVQRILKENGIKSVQGLVDGHAAPSFAPTSAAIAPRVQAKRPVIEEDHEEEEAEDEAERDEEIEEEAEDEADAEGAEDEEEEGGDEDDGEEGEDEEAEEEDEEEAAAAPVAARREPPMTSTSPRVEPQQRPPSRANPVLANPVAARPEPAMTAPTQSARAAAVPAARPNPQRRLERERLEAVLEELLAARRALDTAMKDG